MWVYDRKPGDTAAMNSIHSSLRLILLEKSHYSTPINAKFFRAITWPVNYVHLVERDEIAIQPSSNYQSLNRILDLPDLIVELGCLNRIVSTCHNH